jgi:hypothetical protein
MLITKRIETKVDIHNEMSFARDKNSLLYTLAARFEGKCYRSCLITKILSIVRRSELMVNGEGGSIDVMFEVQGIVLQPGWIITDAVIVNKSSNMGIEVLVATTPHANITFLGEKYLDSVRVGQHLPLMVLMSGYSLYESKIKVHATPKLHMNPPKYFKVHDDDVDVGMLADLLDQIKTMEKQCEPLRTQKSWKFFTDLMYAYKKTPPSAAAIIKDNVNVMDLIQKIKQYTVVGYDNSVDQHKGLVACSAPTNIVPTTIATNTGIVSVMLESYLNGLRVIYELITTHNTPESLADHKNIWLVMNHIKL